MRKNGRPESPAGIADGHYCRQFRRWRFDNDLVQPHCAIQRRRHQGGQHQEGEGCENLEIREKRGSHRVGVLTQEGGQLGRQAQAVRGGQHWSGVGGGPAGGLDGCRYCHAGGVGQRGRAVVARLL